MMRNGDLIVQGIRAGALDLSRFSRSEEMGAWEFASYSAYGDDRCRAENIDTLGDLFGSCFYAKWSKRRNVLLATYLLRESESELVKLQKRIDGLRTMTVEPPEIFPFEIPD